MSNMCPYNYNNFVFFSCMGNIVEVVLSCDLAKLTKDQIHSMLIDKCYDLYLRSDEVMTIYGLSLKRRGKSYNKLDAFINQTKKADVIFSFLDQDDKINTPYDVKRFIKVCDNVGTWYNTREDVLHNA